MSASHSQDFFKKVVGVRDHVWGRQCPKSKNNCSLNSSPPLPANTYRHSVHEPLSVLTHGTPVRQYTGTVILSLARLAVPTPPSYHKNASALASKLAKRPSEHHPVFSERAESVKVLQKMKTNVNFTIGIRKHSSRNAVFYYIKPHLARAIFPILQHPFIPIQPPILDDTLSNEQMHLHTLHYLYLKSLFRYTGTPVHQYTGAQVHRCTGTLVHRYTCIQVHRYIGTKLYGYTSTLV